MYTKETKKERKRNQMEELDLKELLSIFWNKKVQIILITLIFLVIGIIYTIGFTTPMYSASTTLVLATTSENAEKNTNTTITATEITVNSKLVSTYSELVKSKNVLRQVIANLGIQVNEKSLRDNVAVSSVKNTELIEITVKNENASYSAQVANEIAKVFTEKVKEIYNINNVQIVDEAETPIEPSNINHAKDIMMFAFVGLVIAIAYVLIGNMLDTTIKTTEQIEKGFGVPVLVSIPLMENFENERGGRR